MTYVGLGKTIFNSSVCFLKKNRQAEIFLTERLSREKCSGSWPFMALEQLCQNKDFYYDAIVENRDVENSFEVETLLNKKFPFFEALQQKKITPFSAHFNSKISFITHHFAHACAATFMSPFEKTLILVVDGAGSKAKFFNTHNSESTFCDALENSENSAEERTLYSLDSGKLTCLKKEWQTFTKSNTYPSHYFSSGLGTYYEKISELIFNSKTSSGKVMGLASFGKSNKVVNSFDYLNQINWDRRYNGKTKKDWETSKNKDFYISSAADAQAYFENNLISYVEKISKEYPAYENLILMGGCALNCTTNMKIFKKSIFKNVYIPPFPGDESIGLGTAYSAELKSNLPWAPYSYEEQHGYFGPTCSIPVDKLVIENFKDFKITQLNSVADFTAELLSKNKIIGWYQGRSESGPRALGNRSILASPLIKGLKDKLNSEIKFRETFRPYGCSVLFEESHKIFEVPEGFNNPYMSFAVPVKTSERDRLKEVTHIDGTSRMQTVRKSQNLLFYNLIKAFGQKTGLHCVLNTSLNIMGEPIVESIADAKNFITNVPVDGLIIGNFYIQKL